MSTCYKDVSDNRLTSPPRQQNKGLWNKSSKDCIYPAYDEQGVHGGEYSVRPNVQESMVFLRKLFTHQKDGAESVSKLISPPDAPHSKNTPLYFCPACVMPLNILFLIGIPLFNFQRTGSGRVETQKGTNVSIKTERNSVNWSWLTTGCIRLAESPCHERSQ